MRLFSYKLKHDTGFAPNPFFGVLTLATCKPRIRKSKRVGDWIAGFTSRSLCRDAVGEERLIYLMQITDKIPIFEYFLHPNFQNKIPDLDRKEFVYHAGDNIYKPHAGDFIQLDNKNHFPHDKVKDLSGEFVLISTKFYYFGGKPLEISPDLRPRVPVGQSAHGSLTLGEQASKFINYVRNGISKGVHHAPHRWPDSDLSWRM
ncbi:MAG: hypothetical protein KDJ97_23670 [Anaerolineae bacterium]|nr:hypothetical protein [Anaerolineae bacterium]